MVPYIDWDAYRIPANPSNGTADPNVASNIHVEPGVWMYVIHSINTSFGIILY
jgi:hypothetical protein